jgi:transposase-like protein
MAVSKFEEKSAEVLNLLAQGYNIGETCQKVGIDRATLFRWQEENATFATEVTRARKEGEQRAIEDVERALLDVAKGFEYEEVRTEYESKLNPTTNQYEPTIKKQVRIKKRVVPSTEAQKFYLTNKAPELWKNRQQQEISNLDVLKDLRIERVKPEASGRIVHSEDEIED